MNEPKHLASVSVPNTRRPRSSELPDLWCPRPVVGAGMFLAMWLLAGAGMGSELERYNEIHQCLEQRQFDQADQLLQKALREYPDSLRLKSMHYLFYAYLSRTDRKLDAARHAEADMKLWLANIQQTPAMASMLTQRVNTLTTALRDAGKPELAEQKIDETIQRIESIAEEQKRNEFKILIAELNVLKAILLNDIGKAAKGKQLLDHLANTARNNFEESSDDIGHVLTLASVLLARVAMRDSPDQKRQARDELSQFITKQARIHSNSNLVVAKYVDSQLAILDELVAEDAVAAEKHLEMFQQFLASIDSRDAAVQATVNNAARPIDSLRRQIDRAQLHESLIGQPAIPIDADAWVNGSRLTIDDLRDKVVLLNFWAMWSEPCLTMFPHLRQWHQDYASEGLVIIGVTQYYGFDWIDEDKRTESVPELSHSREQMALAEFAKHHQLPYPFAILPEQSDYADKFGVIGIPQTVLIDRTGKIRMIRADAGHAGETESMIQRLLEETGK